MNEQEEEIARLKGQVEILVQLNSTLGEYRQQAMDLAQENSKMRIVLEEIHRISNRFCGRHEERIRKMVAKVLK